MRAFVSFLVMLIFVGAIGYAGLIYLRDNAEKFKPDSLPGKIGNDMRPSAPPAPTARGPQDYHILQSQGGERMAQAAAAGLTSDRWSYLSALTPVQQSAGLELASGVIVRGLNYDMGFRFGPKNAAEQYLEFSLGTKWDELHFGFGFADSEPSDPTNGHAIDFSVTVDGKPVYGPMRLSPVDKPVFFKLDVKGASRVLFVVKRVGSSNTFSPVLLDPFVKLLAPEPSPATTQSDGASR